LRCVRTACAPHGFSMQLLGHSKPLYLPVAHPAVQILTDCYNEATGTNSAPYVTGGGTYARHMPNCVAFGCEFPGRTSPFGAERGGFHQPDECISIDDLLSSLKIYILALLRMDQADLPSI
ncbi:MAG: M20/M25/M40 family metallo-hydrolase, partial [Oscillospiraceae bacterium]